MAGNDTTLPKSPVTLNTVQIGELADRLCDRANAIENIAKPDLAYDLRLASRVITALVRSFNSSDAITLDGNSA